jgi:hypoxanthine-guanine phosphoribosyltransferase
MVATFAIIKSAIPFMDELMRAIAVRAASKLDAMTDAEFGAMTFALDVEGDPDDAV